LVDVCIPSGNFGNIFGAFYAKEMGLPIGKLICASNENNILTDFINTGVFDLRKRKLFETISPAIDILIPSNLERLLFYLTKNAELIQKFYSDLEKNCYFEVDSDLMKKIQSVFIAKYCKEDEIYGEIRKTYNTNKLLLDPHTAVAVSVVRKLKDSKEITNPVLIASTAHYSKFPDACLKSLSIEDSNFVENYKKLNEIEKNNSFHKCMEDIISKEVKHNIILEADIGLIKDTIIENLI
jgi:threonine synthase